MKLILFVLIIFFAGFTYLVVTLTNNEIADIRSRGDVTGSHEAESGVINGNVTLQNDSAASGGKYVSLGLITPTPTTPATTPTPSRTPTPTALPGSWQKVGTHPQAIIQPNEFARTLHTLAFWNGRLYAGYGDANANTGPIAINPFNLTTNQFEGVVHTLETEMITMIRVLDNKLYIISHDTTTGADYAVGEPWTSKNPVANEHAHDMATLTGTDLWISGQKAPAAVLHRSTDGGVTWQQVQQYSTGVCCRRYYFIGVFNGKLYVQAASSGTPHTPQSLSRVFNGSTWSDGPNLLPYGGPGWHPTVFAGKMVYLSSPQFYTDPKYLQAFDGNTVQRIMTNQVLDYAVDNETMYILRTDGKIQKSINLSTWTDVSATSPVNFNSIAVLNGKIYVGTKDAAIYRLGN